MALSYCEFFQNVTGNPPLPYQVRCASDPFSNKLVNVPTGLGKTAAVIVPWLYEHAVSGVAPTRLFFVLPRRSLATQTADSARKWVGKSVGLAGSVHVLELMAGSGDNDKKLRIDQPAIIVATQDLYFSRALNRGYARGPFRWPVDFAMYNQDCLIVLDEIQLMDEALATSAQLSAFRKEFGVLGDSACIWMSATANPEWLETVDFHGPVPRIGLDTQDLKDKGTVQKRLNAAKLLAQAPPTCEMPQGCAEFTILNHRRQTRSLVIANTVERAREIFLALSGSFPDPILLHSRFRPHDRLRLANLLKNESLPPEGQIVISTQVLEAGVDISARLLVTDIAPWSALVQRFGRVNRRGDDADAEIYWVDQPAHSKTNPKHSRFLPYRDDEIVAARSRLEILNSASSANLPAESASSRYQHVLRRADLLDLFDTSPDLAGNSVDVSRFIRATEDKDAFVAWREWEGDQPQDLATVGDDELCPVPIGDLRNFAAKRHLFTFDWAKGDWASISDDSPLYPGMVVLAPADKGGYLTEIGWAPTSKTPVSAAVPDPDSAPSDGGDSGSFPKYRQTLASHSSRVCEELEKLLAVQPQLQDFAADLRRAAATHDWGKAHDVFQATMHKNDSDPSMLAKQCGNGRHSRAHFRHELASALALLQTGASDLAAYLVAAHHGRIRLTIRSAGDERLGATLSTTRGIAEGEILPVCQLGNGWHAPEVRLSLQITEIGAEGGSWAARMLRIRNQLGPFRLAYLEAVLRAADAAASADPGPEHRPCP